MANRSISGVTAYIDPGIQGKSTTPISISNDPWLNSPLHRPSFPLHNSSEDASSILYIDELTLYEDSLSNTVECFEFKSADVTEFCMSKQSVQGRIAANKQWWFDHLQLPAFVSGVLNNGYRLPFVSLPPDSFIKNNQSARSNLEFVSSAIEQLLHDIGVY